MKRIGMYFELNLEACCKKYFNYDYFKCAGTALTAANLPVGFYPNWDINEIQCLEAADGMLDYSALRANGRAVCCCSTVPHPSPS